MKGAIIFSKKLEHYVLSYTSVRCSFINHNFSGAASLPGLPVRDTVTVVSRSRCMAVAARNGD